MSFRFADKPRRAHASLTTCPATGSTPAWSPPPSARGAAKIDESAQFLRDGDSDRIRLAPESLAAARRWAASRTSWSTPPAARAVARMLQIPPSRDRAKTPPCTRTAPRATGAARNNALDRLECGWAWRIPLPGRVSVGIVTPPEHIARFGATIEEQYDAFLRKGRVRPAVGREGRASHSVGATPTTSCATRAVGPGWGLVADAFGFIDPVLSSGTLLAFDGAGRSRTRCATGRRER
jgi:hypothetical protein